LKNWGEKEKMRKPAICGVKGDPAGWHGLATSECYRIWGGERKNKDRFFLPGGGLFLGL